MRRLFRDLDMEAKLRLLIVLTSLATLVAGSVVFGVTDHLLALRALAEGADVDRGAIGATGAPERAEPTANPRVPPPPGPDTGIFGSRAVWLAIVGLGAAGLSVAFALAVASRFARRISGPVRELLDVVERVGRERDFSLRADATAADEFGALARAFNQMIGAIGVHDDQQQRARRMLEVHAVELTRSNAALDEFAYIASHDLKEPLRGIHNYSRFLLDDYGEVLDDEGREMLDRLGALSSRMEALIESLLHFSRLGRTKGACGPTDLGAVVADVLDSLGERLREDRVEVAIPDPLPAVVCDRVRVAEVFRNLVCNAVKYNEGDTRRVEILWREDGAPPDGAVEILCPSPAGEGPVFTVRDDGIGIREKHLASVFRMFKRLHGQDRYGGGTGAGLGIVKRIVEQHGGGLWLESVFGEGTSVHFCVGPVAPEEEAKREQYDPGRGGQPGRLPCDGAGAA